MAGETALRPYHLPPGAAEKRWSGETFTHFLATGASTGGAFALVDETARRGEAVPLHRHRADVESFYVVEGEVAFYLGEGPFQGRAGAFVHVPAGAVHGFRVVSETARYLILTTPRHGELYRAMTMPAKPDGGPPDGPFDWSKLKAITQEYGIEFVGPLPDAG